MVIASYSIGDRRFAIVHNPRGWVEFCHGDDILGMVGPYCQQTAKQSLETHLDVLAGLIKQYFDGN